MSDINLQTNAVDKDTPLGVSNRASLDPDSMNIILKCISTLKKEDEEEANLDIDIACVILESTCRYLSDKFKNTSELVTKFVNKNININTFLEDNSLPEYGYINKCEDIADIYIDAINNNPRYAKRLPKNINVKDVFVDFLQQLYTLDGHVGQCDNYLVFGGVLFPDINSEYDVLDMIGI